MKYSKDRLKQALVELKKMVPPFEGGMFVRQFSISLHGDSGLELQLPLSFVSETQRLAFRKCVLGKNNGIRDSVRRDRHF